MNFQKFYSKHNLNLTNKKIIVTGANSGVGFSIVKHLVRLNAKVVMACRNKNRCDKAISDILKEYPNANIEYLHFDQSTLNTSKNSLNNLIQSEHMDFDYIIFNAGILSPEDNRLNEDGFPITIATNYINVVYIVEQLSKYVDKNKDIRFIFQSSLTSRMYKKTNFLLNNKVSKMKQYSLSKFCITNYKNYKVSFNNTNNKFLVSEPGITNSNIIRNLPKVINVLGNWFLKLFMMKVDKASLNAIMCLQDEINDGSEYRPRGLFAIRGLPRLVGKNNKIDFDVINKTMEIINE